MKRGHEALRVRPEHYLEAVFSLEPDATLTNVAKAVGVKPSTARKMLKALEELGYVEYMGRDGVRLTELGRRAVEDLNRRHRALADFLKAVGVEEELAEAEAEKLEHVVDPRVVERLEAAGRLLRLLKEICGRA